MRARALVSSCAASSLLAIGLLGRTAAADQTLTFDGTVTDGGLDHELVEFDVPEGVAEIQIDHDNVSGKGVLDWGLNDPDGFRGWGGGNKEPAIVGVEAASRSYLPGPIKAGKWRVVIGKAQIYDGAADYHVVVTLRDAPTLAPQSERRAYTAVAPLSAEVRYYAGDLHAHSRESGDAAPTIDDLVTFARSQGLDFLELSDHNTVSQLGFIGAAQDAHPDILIVPGVEFTTYDGHANGIGATAWVDHKIGQPGVDIAGAAGAFRAQGALFSINHPLFQLGDLCIGCSWGHDLSPEGIDAVEIATAGTGSLFADSTLAFWDALCDTGRHVSAVGGSDDHSAGKDEGSFSTPTGTPATYVLADGLSVASLLTGIRNSRTVVKLGGVTDPMVELTSEIAIDGDTVHAEHTSLSARVTGAKGLEVTWVKNGKEIQSDEVTEDPMDLVLPVDVPAEGEDRYRVQVYREGRVVTITGHVWVRFAAGVGVKPEDELPATASAGCTCRSAGDPGRRGVGEGLLLLGALALVAGRRRHA